MKLFNLFNNLKSTRYLGNKFDIDIHGSCVSRDILNFDSNQDLILGNYFARNSFISTVSKPFPDEFNLIISSPWQKLTVEIDLKKELFKKLSAENANYLLIDFIDERLALMKYKDSINTFSDELGESDFSDYYDIEYIDKFSLKKSYWKRSMKQYIKNLLRIYYEERIIIHETYFVDSYITGSGEIEWFSDDQIEFNHNINALLEEYYHHIKTKLPDANVLNIIADYNMAYENHIWGNQPVHYIDDYYINALKILKNIILSK